jgi:hypothetical protein
MHKQKQMKVTSNFFTVASGRCKRLNPFGSFLIVQLLLFIHSEYAHNCTGLASVAIPQRGLDLSEAVALQLLALMSA